MPIDATGATVTAVTTPLLSVEELAIWARQDIAVDDAFALAVIDAASLKTRSETKQWLWDLSTIPPEARLVCIQLAKRTYLNPDAIVSEGGIGPIGGDRYVEDFARTLEFTDAELAVLSEASGAAAAAGNGLWIQPTSNGEMLGIDRDVYLFDDSGSDWGIPMYRDIGNQTP